MIFKFPHLCWPLFDLAMCTTLGWLTPSGQIKAGPDGHQAVSCPTTAHGLSWLQLLDLQYVLVMTLHGPANLPAMTNRLVIAPSKSQTTSSSMITSAFSVNSYKSNFTRSILLRSHCTYLCGTAQVWSQELSPSRQRPLWQALRKLSCCSSHSIGIAWRRPVHTCEEADTHYSVETHPTVKLPKQQQRNKGREERREYEQPQAMERPCWRTLHRLFAA